VAALFLPPPEAFRSFADMDDSESHVLEPAVQGLVDRFRAGEPLALARCITRVENQVGGFEDLLHELHEGVGRARRTGLTGPPGAGKSTLTAALARHLRDRGETVGIVAVDPSSPFTGGALLGDRVRMDDLVTEPGIFIRSMASRGSHGGLATTTREAADLMDAFGFDHVLLETVGVGQSELEVATNADTTVVVLVPESGDGIQAMKAGLMEVADLFVVNKADRPGADRLKKEIEVVQAIRTGTSVPTPAHHGIDLSRLAGEATGAGSDLESMHSSDPPGEAPDEEPWEAPVLKCTASQGEGIVELVARLDDHFAWLQKSGRLGDRRHLAALEHAHRVLERSVERGATRVWRDWVAGEGSDPATDLGSPYAIARILAARLAAGTADSGA
jgi:LAO/AO transport system kinase